MIVRENVGYSDYQSGNSQGILIHILGMNHVNVKIVMQKVGKGPEQNLMMYFDEFKINNGILHCFERKNALSAS